LRFKFVDGLVGYYNFEWFKIKPRDTLPFYVICVKHTIHEHG